MNKKILAFVCDGEKFLLLRNNSKDPSHGGDFWFTVTGSVEQNEIERDAVKREVLEETGLKVKEIFDLNWGSIYSWNNKEYRERNFIAFVEMGRIKLNEEHIDSEWLNLNEFVNKIKWGLNKDELETILTLGINKEKSFDFVRIDEFFSKSSPKTIIFNEDEKVNISWKESKDFSKLKNVIQCYGVCFNEKGQIVIVSNKRNRWVLPGGTPEKGETFEETLIREVDEEADIEIGHIIPIGYNKLKIVKSKNKSELYQLRYLAKITKIKKQTIDPATNMIFERKFINPEEFLKYALWGKPGELMIKKAIEIFRKNRV